MYKLSLALAGAMAALQSVAFAQRDFDYVRTAAGNTIGTVTEVTPFKVTVDQGQKGTAEVDVNQISYIQYVDEPRDLTMVRTQIVRGAYEEALKQLSSLNLPEDAKPAYKQDVEFYRALASARLAMAGKGELVDAGKLLLAFVTDNKGSYHFLEANEVLGDLLTAMGRYEQAQPYYGTLAKAPWEDYKMKAALAVGRSLQAQKKHTEALAEFDKVIASGASVKGAEAQVLGAMVGKASSLTASGKPAEAVPVLQQVIDKADPTAVDVYARAYNALGAAQRALKQPKDALLAYLHVHLMFSTLPEAHAEALANLAQLWIEVNQPERAEEATELLLQSYPNSRWAKKQ